MVGFESALERDCITFLAGRVGGRNGDDVAEAPTVDYSKPPRVYDVEEW